MSAPSPAPIASASPQDRATALWVLSRPWDPPRWQRRICLAILEAPVERAQLGLFPSTAGASGIEESR